MDTSHVVSVLQSTSNPDNTIRMQAELEFNRLCTFPGLCSCLLSIMTNVNNANTLRFTAGVYLKIVIQRNWVLSEDAVLGEDDASLESSAVFGEEHVVYSNMMKELRMQQIEISVEDKQYLRDHMLPLLGEMDEKIRKIVATCICSIANIDIDSWPALPGLLVQFIQSNPPQHAFEGVLYCLGIIMEDVPDSTLLKTIATAFETLLLVAEDKNKMYSVSLKSHALSIFIAYLNSLTVLEVPGSSDFEKQCKKHLLPCLPRLLEVCCGILGNSMTELDTFQHYIPNILTSMSEKQQQQMLMFEARHSAMRVITLLTAYLPRVMVGHTPVLLVSVEEVLFKSSQYYMRNIVSASTSSVNIDDKDEHSVLYKLSSLMEECFQFFILLTDSAKTLGKTLRTRLSDICMLLSVPLALTETDVEDYSTDPSLFAMSENNTDSDSYVESGEINVRKSALLLWNSMLEKWPVSAGIACAEAIKKFMQLAHQLKDTDPVLCYKYMEMGILLLGTLLFSGKAFLKQEVIPFEAVLTGVLPMIMHFPEVPQDTEKLVYARTLWVLYPIILRHCDVDVLAAGASIRTAMNMLDRGVDSESIIVRLSAVRTLRLLKETILMVDSEVLSQSMERGVVFQTCMGAFSPELFTKIINLQQEVDGEAFVLTLDTLSCYITFVLELKSVFKQYFETEDQVMQALQAHPVVCGVINSCPLIIKAFLHNLRVHIANPVTVEVVLDTLHYIAYLPAAFPVFVGDVIPFVISMLQLPTDEEHSITLKFVSLWLLSTTIKAGAPGPYTVCPVSTDLLNSDYIQTIKTIPEVANFNLISPTHKIPKYEAFTSIYSSLSTTLHTTTSPLSAQEVCTNIFPHILTLAVSTPVKTIKMSSCAVLATILGIYNTYIPQDPSNIPRITDLVQLCLQIIQHIQTEYTDEKNDKYSESEYRHVARLFTQVCVHYQQYIPDGMLQEGFVQLLKGCIQSGQFTTKIALSIALARISLKNPILYLQFFKSIPVISVVTVDKQQASRNRKTGKWTEAKVVKVEKQFNGYNELFQVWCTLLQESASPYCSKIISSLFCMYATSPECLALLQDVVIVEDVQPSMVEDAGMKLPFATRSNTKVQSKQVRGLEKMKFCLTTLLDKLSQDHPEENPFDDIETDDETNESMPTQEEGPQDTQQISDLLDFDMDGEDGMNNDISADMTDFPESLYDILNGIDILAVLRNTLSQVTHQQ